MLKSVSDCVGRYPLDIVFSIPEHAGVEEAAKYIDFIKEVSTAAKISPKQVSCYSPKNFSREPPNFKDSVWESSQLSKQSFLILLITF